MVKIQKVTIKRNVPFGLVFTYFDSSRRHTHATTHATGTQIVRAKMTSLNVILFRGNKSSSGSLAGFCCRKQKIYRSRVALVKKNWAPLDFLKVLRFPFPVPVVGPSAKDFYPLQRAKFYRRNFPPVGFIQSLFNHERFYWCAVNETRSRHMKRDLNCFDPNSLELCIFCRLYFDFFLSPVFKYKALVGDLSSFIRALYQGWIFLGATEQKRYRLVLLGRR